MTLSTTLPNVVWSGSFRIFGVDLKCHVLSDGQQIIEAGGVAALIEAMEAPENGSSDELEDFCRWQKMP